eukprot:TRINITY_DN26518_c0_g1_i1.p1 TRINITY_DN26518_c0_g1~~TRINITY_DN26518_c0_g1_i1.p1  ORF type:complete len:384 (-),score=94.52 TRINITY_DN26518_c0_g1_i1:51-1202(-)
MDERCTKRRGLPHRGVDDLSPVELRGYVDDVLFRMQLRLDGWEKEASAQKNCMMDDIEGLIKKKFVAVEELLDAKPSIADLQMFVEPLEKLEANVNSLSERLSSCAKDFAALQRSVAKLGEEVVRLDAASSSELRLRDLADLEHVCRRLQAQVGSLESDGEARLKHLETVLDGLKAQVNETVAQLTYCQKELSKTSQDASSLQLEHRKQMTLVRESKSSVEAKLGDIEGNLGSQAKDLQCLSLALRDKAHESDLRSMSTMVAQLQKQASFLEKELSKAGQAESQQDVQQSLSCLQTHVARLMMEMDGKAFRQQLLDLQCAVEALQTTCGRNKEGAVVTPSGVQLDGIRDDLASLRQKVMRLEHSLQQVDSKIFRQGNSMFSYS